jgi:hypothetical protein
LINQGRPIHSLRRLLGHQQLDTTLIYAHIYDETVYEHFKAAMARLEAIEVYDWPGVETSEPILTQISQSIPM